MCVCVCVWESILDFFFYSFIQKILKSYILLQIIYYKFVENGNISNCDFELFINYQNYQNSKN